MKLQALRRSAARCIPAALLALGGCDDAPTIPDAIQLFAGGEEWVAVSAPHDLPRLETWMSYLPAGSTRNGALYSQVRELEAQAAEARQQGRLGDAGRLGAEAERIVVGAIDRAPEPQLLNRALGALQFWSERVSARTDLETAPDLAASLDAVIAGRDRAVHLLDEGDTIAAMLQIAAASRRVREHAPETIALRVLARAEARLAAEVEIESAAAERALHLLSTARHEVVHGDPRRALQRALYALQIIEGSEVRTISSGPDSACLGPFC